MILHACSTGIARQCAPPHLRACHQVAEQRQVATQA